MKEKFLTVRELKEEIAGIDSKYDDHIVVVSNIQETIYTPLGKEDLYKEDKFYIPDEDNQYRGQLKLDNKYKHEYMSNINWAYCESDFCTEEEQKTAIPVFCLEIEC